MNATHPRLQVLQTPGLAREVDRLVPGAVGTLPEGLMWAMARAGWFPEGKGALTMSPCEGAAGKCSLAVPAGEGAMCDCAFAVLKWQGAASKCSLATRECEGAASKCSLAMRGCEGAAPECSLAMRGCEDAAPECSLATRECESAALECSLAARKCSLPKGGENVRFGGLPLLEKVRRPSRCLAQRTPSRSRLLGRSSTTSFDACFLSMAFAGLHQRSTPGGPRAAGFTFPRRRRH